MFLKLCHICSILEKRTDVPKEGGTYDELQRVQKIDY